MQHLSLLVLFLLSLWQWEGIKCFDLYPHFSPYPEEQPGVASPWDTPPVPQHCFSTFCLGEVLCISDREQQGRGTLVYRTPHESWQGAGWDTSRDTTS